MIRIARVAVVFACASCFGQPVPPRAPGAAGAETPTPATTIKTNARIVVLDVVVKNAAGHPVHGLKAADFSVTENNQPQNITHFQEHVGSSPAGSADRAPQKLPPGIFTNAPLVPPLGVVNVLLIDALNTPLADQSFLRQQLLQYLKSPQARTPTAIFSLNQHLVMLQGFTSAPDVLTRILSTSKGKGSAVLEDPTGRGGVQNSTSDTLEDMEADPTIVANVHQFEQSSQSFQEHSRAKYTLDAMNQLARYLATIPGRKNLIWFSGSFPVNILPDMNGSVPDPFRSMGSADHEFRQTSSMLSAAQVAVYPVDARGVFNSPMFDVATTRNYSGPRGPARMQQDQNKFNVDTVEEQSTMREMAAATGGRAFVNTNGLAAAVAAAIEEGSNFYTLSYTPSDTAADGALRKIKVQVAQPGVTLAYRQGYYADRPANSTSVAQGSAESGSAATSSDAVVLSMLRGAPVPTEITMNIGAVPITGAGQTEDKVAAGNHPMRPMPGPYLRYSINYEVNAGDLNFMRQADGKIHADVDLIIFVYTGAGELINTSEGQVHIAASMDEIRSAVAKGIIWHEEVSTPAKGDYFLRIGVRDEHTGRFGAVEVATSQLKPVPQLKTAQ